MKIYLDVVVILNFLVDLLLLLAANRLSGYPDRWRRLLPAATLGALYSGLCMIPRLFFLGHPLWYLVCLCFITVIAFGTDRSALRRGAVFLILSLALGGLALALRESRFEILILEALLLWLLSRAAFGGNPIGTQYIPVTVSAGNRTVSFMALHDTGNQLRDPISGDPVMVVAPEQAEKLTGLSRQQISHPLETMASRPIAGLRLIPYCAVGTGSAMLLALRFSSVTVGSHTGEALIAFAPESLGMQQALIGGSIC